MLSRKVFPGISFSIDCRKMSIFTLERVAQSTLGSAQRAAMQTTKPVRVEMIIVSIKTEKHLDEPLFDRVVIVCHSSGHGGGAHAGLIGQQTPLDTPGSARCRTCRRKSRPA